MCMNTAGKRDVHSHLELALHDFQSKRSALETLEKTAIRSVFIEERRRFCNFIRCLQPVLVLDCLAKLISLCLVIYYVYIRCDVLLLNCSVGAIPSHRILFISQLNNTKLLQKWSINTPRVFASRKCGAGAVRA